MLESLKKSFARLKVNSVDEILEKILVDGKAEPPKEKYVKQLTEELKSKTAFLVFTKINDALGELEVCRWMPALKLCYTVHLLLNVGFWVIMCCRIGA